jgi:small subunit ribosomal protein S17
MSDSQNTAPESEATAPTAQRSKRKDLVGVVTGITGNKSIKVTVFYKISHPQYRKEVKRKTVVHAHDEDCACALGDKVEIMETRPLSKLKRWRVVSVLEKAPIVGAI